MKRSTRILYSLGFGLAAAMLGLLSWSWRRCTDGLRALTIGPDVIEAPIGRPTVALQRAKQFTQRLVKRDRPVVTPRWRMCPST